ncbi:hypothetical protein V8C86DRAFT_1790414 [Haematococcus lacustris]
MQTTHPSSQASVGQGRLLPSRPRTSRRALRMAVTASAVKPQIMVNSCLGKMGQAVAEATLRAGLELVPYTLCPAEAAGAGHVSVGDRQVKLVGPADQDALMDELRSRYPQLVVVDYTLPHVIHDMAAFYIKHRTPFVMGTSGGDRARLLKDVQSSGLHAVVAPNMGKQIVAFQAMLEHAAQTYPGAFAGYKLRVIESHQSSKKDTSGTAIAVVASFVGLGLDFDVSQIELVRQPAQQVELMKVPESALQGHAYHTYQLVSGDGSVMFEFQHNVIGRTTYAEGSVDACLFLAAQVQAGSSRTLFNMVDVLKAGAMR